MTNPQKADPIENNVNPDAVKAKVSRAASRSWLHCRARCKLFTTVVKSAKPAVAIISSLGVASKS